ncbi:hypothetical protein JXO52_02540 [bacterium]|nr:hypothetical protein [bacterium]
MKRFLIMCGLLAAALVLVPGCGSRPPATISVFNPTFERVKDRIDPVSFGMNVPADRALQTAEDVLTLLSIPFHMEGTGRNRAIRIEKACIAVKGKEFGEYFDYEKLDEHAGYWDFDPEALANGRKGNIVLYVRTPQEGLGGLVKSAAAGQMKELENVWFEGEVSVTPVGRVRALMNIKIVFYDEDFKGKAYRSQGRIEQEIADRCTALLEQQSSVLPAGIDTVQAAVMSWLAIQKLDVTEDENGRIVTSRGFTDVGWEGPKTIDRYAEIPLSFMGIWYGTYRAVITLSPEQNGAATRITPGFAFMGINLNNGKRRWMVLPSKQVLEPDLLAHVRREISKEE